MKLTVQHVDRMRSLATAKSYTGVVNAAPEGRGTVGVSLGGER
jgi:hypothetical protein